MIVAAIEVGSEENLDKLVDAEPEIPDELNDRAADGWEPLLAIAERGTTDCREARPAAVALSSEIDIEDDSYGIQLLADLREVWGEETTTP